MQVSKEQVEQWQEIILPSIQVFARFYLDEVADITQSNLQGKRVVKKCLILETKVRGDRFSLLNKEATEQDKKIYRHEYNLFLENENAKRKRSERTIVTEKRSERTKEPDKQVNSINPETRRGSHLKEVQAGWGELRVGSVKQAFPDQSGCLNIEWVGFENA